MNTSIRKFLAEEDGVTALEYGILAAIVAALIATIFHDQLSGIFTRIFNSLTSSIKTGTA
jgi:pilus assembly protein Flp/PilA